MGSKRDGASERDVRLDAARKLYAQVIAAAAGNLGPRLEAALLAVARDVFLGPPPWHVSLHAMGQHRFIEVSDPIHTYQSLLFALDRDKGINNRDPGLHAMLLGALAPRVGDTLLHIGTGLGYYTAVLAELVGPSGAVQGYEIEPTLAARAVTLLKPWPQAAVASVSGVDAALPSADGIYVNAGATRPHARWLDALRDGGRLVFPLTSGGVAGWGVSLVVTRVGAQFAARAISRAGFISCVGATDDEEGRRVAQAAQSGKLFSVKSLHRNSAPDESVVVAGDSWWLSSRAITPLEAAA